jgi:uncharacterized repeat protein (TIGR01451 family)
MRRVLILTAVLIALLTCASSAMAAEIPFQKVFSENINGNIAIAANGSVQCDATQAQCAEALYRKGKLLNNNDWAMQYVDIDEDPTSFSSSSSVLDLPVGARVLYAGLYWGGYTAHAGRGAVGLREGNGDYVSIKASELGTFGASGQAYGGSADVTDYVREHGRGTYWVSNIRTNVGNKDVHAGWSLVVAYANPADPPRNLSIFDGYLAVESGKASVTADVNGFLTPKTGPVRTAVGAVAWEGDLNLTGDQMLLNGRQLSNNANPANNVFNSSISTFGSFTNTRLPAYTNLLGVDADIFGADATYLPNNSSSAKVQVLTNSDRILLSTLTFATELYAPNLETRKDVNDLNGGAVEPGDVLEYVIETRNTGSDDAVDLVLTDDIPPHTAYIDGSAEATNGVAGEVRGIVKGWLGTGAAAHNGGTLAPGESASVTFRVRVDESAPDATHIPNTVNVVGTAPTIRSRMTNYSNTESVVVGKVGEDSTGGPDGDKSPDPVINSGETATGATSTTTSLGVTITPSKKRPRAGTRFTYTVRTVNTGADLSAEGVETCVPLPAQVVVTKTFGGVVKDGRVCWATGAITPGAVAGHRLQVRVSSFASGAVVIAPASAVADNAKRARAASRVVVPRDGITPFVPTPVTG